MPDDPIVPDEGAEPEADPTPTPDAWAEGMPEEWKGKSQTEITSLWSSAATVLDARNTEVEALRTQLEAAQNVPVVAPEPAPVEPAPEPVDFKTLIFDDPEKAIELKMEEKYGKRAEEIDQDMSQLAVLRVEREFSDFEQHRDTVQAILAQNPGQRVTDHTVRAAYLMSKGNEALQAEKAAVAAAVHNEPPSAPEPVKAEVKITTVEQEVARAMGFETDAEFAEWRDMDDDIEVEVPLGDSQL